MANIIDFSDAPTQEGLIAKNYEVLLEEATNKDNKKVLQELIKLSEKKMQILIKLINDTDWFFTNKS